MVRVPCPRALLGCKECCVRLRPADGYCWGDGIDDVIGCVTFVRLLECSEQVDSGSDRCPDSLDMLDSN